MQPGSNDRSVRLGASVWAAADHPPHQQADHVTVGFAVGRLLVSHALAFSPTLDTEVNTQNEQAIRFYRRLGFIETGHSPTDDDDPITRMRLSRL